MIGALSPSTLRVMASVPIQAAKQQHFGLMMATHIYVARVVQNQLLFRGGSNISVLPKRSFTQQILIRRPMSNITEDGAGTHMPSAFQKKIMVWAKMYPSVDKVPERVTRTKVKTAMDKFRIRASLFMVAGTFIFSAIFALIGRKERQEGKSVTKNALERYTKGSQSS